MGMLVTKAFFNRIGPSRTPTCPPVRRCLNGLECIRAMIVVKGRSFTGHPETRGSPCLDDARRSPADGRTLLRLLRPIAGRAIGRDRRDRAAGAQASNGE